MATKPKRPCDTNQLAKFITDLATGEIELPKTDDGKTQQRLHWDAREGSRAARPALKA
jgi:hypothetical protein